MHLPPDNLLIDFLYWMINTAGVGGLAVGLIGGGSLLAYAATLWWIHKGGEALESDVYVYPTPSLHEHADH